MIFDLNLQCLQIESEARARHIRFPVILSEFDLKHFSLNTLQFPCLIVSDAMDLNPDLSWSKVKRLLGQECDHVLLDCRLDFDIENLCALAGCIRGGGLLFILIDEHFVHRSLFHQRLYRFFYHPAVIWLNHSTFAMMDLNLESNPFIALPTPDQSRAIEGIERVLSGHRRRPALLVADRGRGKSSALGIAARIIMQKAPKRILITAQSIANVRYVFFHASTDLENDWIIENRPHQLQLRNGSVLEFIAPDALIRDFPACDLLLVDEAASIPLPILMMIHQHYSRIVFATTEHGYEGTGRSFTHQFKKRLNEKSKGWREYRLVQPIRYAQNDPLEQWLFDTFIFNADPPFPLNDTEIDYSIVSKQELFNNESLLRQVFALLISAHYQTSPNELLQLLNDLTQTIVVARVDHLVIGLVLVQQEGQFSSELANEIIEGKRRPKGHLLAQSLGLYLGDADVLTRGILRISRIAVRHEFRRQGVGLHLLALVEQFAKQQAFDLIGTSFGVTPHLYQFWLQAEYRPIRMGVSRDAASGSYSIQMLKSLTCVDMPCSELTHHFYHHLCHQFAEQYQDMSADLVYELMTNSNIKMSISNFQYTEVERFARGVLGYDLVVMSLYSWVKYVFSSRSDALLADNSTFIVIEKVLQRHTWSDIAKRYDLTGRKQVEFELRQWFLNTLSEKSSC